MNYKNIPIPEQMQHLPVYAGFPIPFVTMVDDDGIPDFRVINERKRQKCIQENLCGICGKPFDDNCFAFIGGGACKQSHLFTDPPMHSPCARYAAQVCPFLAGDKREYSKTQSKTERQAETAETTIIKYNKAEQPRPQKMGIFYTRSWEAVRLRSDDGKGCAYFFKAGKYFKIDWKIMPKTIP